MYIIISYTINLHSKYIMLDGRKQEYFLKSHTLIPNHLRSKFIILISNSLFQINFPENP
jgi:hypothetical protein